MGVRMTAYTGKYPELLFILLIYMQHYLLKYLNIRNFSSVTINRLSSFFCVHRWPLNNKIK